MFNRYFFSVFEMKQEKVSIPYDVVDRIESLPSVIKEVVSQQLLKLNIVTSTGLDYFHVRVLKELSEELSASLLFFKINLGNLD